MVWRGKTCNKSANAIISTLIVEVTLVIMFLTLADSQNLWSRELWSDITCPIELLAVILQAVAEKTAIVLVQIWMRWFPKLKVRFLVVVVLWNMAWKTYQRSFNVN